MSEISINLIKQLRRETGVSIMQCKKALAEADGDLEKAKITLTKKSGEIAAKKGDRELNSGIIVTTKNSDKIIILELACETDFVANNNDFKKLALKLAEDSLNGKNIAEKVQESTQKFGERIEVIKSEILEFTENNSVGFYVHSNNSIGALVKFSNKISKELAKNIAMHITAQHPKYLQKEDIPETERKKAEETLKEEVKDKPTEMQEKILIGKMNSYFKERVLLSQVFIKDSSKTITDLLGDTEIVKYIRFGVGEI